MQQDLLLPIMASPMLENLKINPLYACALFSNIKSLHPIEAELILQTGSGSESQLFDQAGRATEWFSDCTGLLLR
jgi:hypothetical protein